VYDPEGDILSISFGKPTAATGYQLCDQILLRVDPRSREAAGLTIFNFSIHAHKGKEIPLPGIEDDPEVKPFLLQILGTPPVAHFLRVVEGERGVSVVLLHPSLQEAVVG
jgi:uncharacterized protein YuzE